MHGGVSLLLLSLRRSVEVRLAKVAVGVNFGVAGVDHWRAIGREAASHVLARRISFW